MGAFVVFGPAHIAAVAFGLTGAQNAAAAAATGTLVGGAVVGGTSALTMLTGSRSLQALFKATAEISYQTLKAFVAAFHPNSSTMVGRNDSSNPFPWGAWAVDSPQDWDSLPDISSSSPS